MDPGIAADRSARTVMAHSSDMPSALPPGIAAQYTVHGQNMDWAMDSDALADTRSARTRSDTSK